MMPSKTSRASSSPRDTADEAILQIQFTDDLLGIHPKPGDPSSKLNSSTQALVGKEITLSYAERVPSPQSFGGPAPGGEEPRPAAKSSGRFE